MEWKPWWSPNYNIFVNKNRFALENKIMFPLLTSLSHEILRKSERPNNSVGTSNSRCHVLPETSSAWSSDQIVCFLFRLFCVMSTTKTTHTKIVRRDTLAQNIKFKATFQNISLNLSIPPLESGHCDKRLQRWVWGKTHLANKQNSCDFYCHSLIFRNFLGIPSHGEVAAE